jgi:hypothetical protein
MTLRDKIIAELRKPYDSRTSNIHLPTLTSLIYGEADMLTDSILAIIKPCFEEIIKLANKMYYERSMPLSDKNARHIEEIITLCIIDEQDEDGKLREGIYRNIDGVLRAKIDPDNEKMCVYGAADRIMLLIKEARDDTTR